MAMLNQLIEKLTDEIAIDHQFYPDDLVMVTTTYLGGTILYTHEFDLSEIYTAFKERLEDEAIESRVVN